MAICNGQSPEGLNYNTKVMRKHLAGCLEDKVFCYFPAKGVLNRKQKDQNYSRFTVPAVCLKVEREWLPVTTVVNGTMRAASIAWFHLRHGLTAITSGHVIFVSYYFTFLHIANTEFCSPIILHVFCSSNMQVHLTALKWNLFSGRLLHVQAN